MPPIERDAPVDRALRHQHSASSDQGRALIPMWDSSDPDRAPPPLPLNPQSPSVASRPGTSTAIQSAHAALTEKARESSMVPSIAKRIGEVSPEKSLVKGSAHRRMQSLQPGTVRDLSLMIEGGRDSTSSTPRSPEKNERPSTPLRNSINRDPFVDVKTDERDEKALVHSPRPGPSLTPIVRPSVRRPHQSILGENTPPQSATMLALQNMATPTAPRESPVQRDTPLANITNESMAVVKTPHAVDNLSSQILHLTSIATALQKEMSALSRRSRDNAADLLSLKEATTTRDEDIRKNLRDLVSSGRSSTRDSMGAPLLLEGPKSQASSPLSMAKSTRSGFLPRIPSPSTFAASLERGSVDNTPMTFDGESSTAISLCEKILREMGTRSGQDMLLARLTQIADKISGTATSEKVEELVRFVKENQEHAMVPAAGGGGGGGYGGNRSRNFSFDEDEDPRRHQLDYSTAGPMTQRVERLLQHRDERRASAPGANAGEVVNEDVLKVIRTVKDSVAQGGGLTAEVKALVRELRGEVLGMGREIGRRLDEAAVQSHGQGEPASRVEVHKVVAEGLEEMKQHMNHLLREHRRQSAASAASRASAVDYQEVYRTMKTALRESQAQPVHSDLSREDVIHAVREAWENYKPEIEVQQLGLEREEILECLREGLQAYTQPAGATREEVFKAVVEGLKHFVPPQVDTPASLSRDEILEAVRECLEEFEFPVAPSAMGAEISKEDMAAAVRQGLETYGLPATGSRGGVDFTRDDMIDAIREGITAADISSARSALIPHDGSTSNNGEIVSRLHEIMEFMQTEFQAVSDEAKQNVAANGRDTEQVLDATKDGFEKLRTDIEGYVDRATGAAGQEQFLQELVRSLDGFRDEVNEMLGRVASESRQAVQSEIETLRETVNTSIVPASPQAGNHKEILEALREGLSSLRTEISGRPVSGMNEILDALQEGLGDLRVSIDRLHNKPTDLTANDEILDALKSGLEGVRSDIDGLREDNKSERALAPVGAGSGDIIPAPADTLKHEDIKNLEVMITQLRIKVEAIEVPAPSAAAPSISKEDITEMEEMLRNVQESVAGMATPEARAASDPATREDVEAIETILRNTKARLDDVIDGEQAVRKDHIDAIETLILETREGLTSMAAQLDALSSKEDVTAVESLVTQIIGAFDDAKERHEKQLEDPEKVTKTDVDAVEAVCLDIKALVEQTAKTDIAALSSKEDLSAIEELVKGLKERLDGHGETSAKAFEERQAEIVGVSERVTEVKTFLEEFQGVVKEKLEGGATGIDAINTLLETMNESIGKNSTVGDDVKEMFEAMKLEFEESRAGVVGAKLDADEKFQMTTETISSKFDERITELITKYDEFQIAMEERSKAGEARDVEMEAAMIGTKAIADELKSLIDTLGVAVTDSLEKMEEASKTVFSRVEDLVNKSEENHSDGKAEHELTREQVKHAIGVVEGLQGHVVEYQPQILETVKDVLQIVGQHYEHSKSSADNITQQIEAAKPPEQPLLPPVEKYDDTNVQEKLDRLVGHTYEADKAFAQLDKLVDHTQEADKAFAQLDTLDKVHQQVMQTAAEITEFIAAQKQRVIEEQEDREKTLQETNIAIERRLVERDQVESNVASLKEEEERLRQSILGLRSEQEAMSRQRTRMTADVSSLETALRLRREELAEMEARAEGLERRILEGVMDHSRVLLMAKAGRTKGRGQQKEGPDVMSRKRVPSQKPAAGTPPPLTAPITTNLAAAQKPRSAFNMALGAKRNNLAPPATAESPHTARRILSLSQITHNVPGGGFKRSQSVRHPASHNVLRKSSWAGSGRLGGGKGYGDLGANGGGFDKENIEQVKESDEEDGIVVVNDDESRAVVPYDNTMGSELTLADSNPDSDHGEDAGELSEPETLRRSSRGTTVLTGTEEGDYSEEDEYTGSEYTESALGTESNLGTESMVSGGSDVDGMYEV